MQRKLGLLLFTMLAIASFFFAYGQEVQFATTSNPANQKTLVVATESKSDSVVAVPPVTSVTIELNRKKKPSTGPIDLPSWIAKEDAVNGLESADLLPWHIVVSYDQYDRDGDNVHSGVYEEFWAGEKKYKRAYKSDNLNQTDYGTDKGLFRQGDQTWPYQAESQVRSEVISPFYYAATLQGFRGRRVDRNISNYTLECVSVEDDSGQSNPTQYCFEPGGSVLRYSHGESWYQTVYNRIEQFQGRNVAREVDVTDAGNPYLKIRVDTLELIPHVDEQAFLPPRDATGPIGGRISGVQVRLLSWSPPELPASLRQQHFVVKLEIVIGTDGHVISAHASSGPPGALKPCEEAARKWVFKPYLVLGKPVEVEMKTEFANN